MDLKNKVCLVVDDEKEIVEYMQLILRKSFKDVIVAFNGVEGVEVFKDRRPDIVIADVTMPKMNGIDMCKMIRDIDESTKLVIVSGNSLKDVEDEISELNLIFFRKPLIVKKLIEALQEIN